MMVTEVRVELPYFRQALEPENVNSSSGEMHNKVAGAQVEFRVFADLDLSEQAFFW